MTQIEDNLEDVVGDLDAIIPILQGLVTGVEAHKVQLQQQLDLLFNDVQAVIQSPILNSARNLLPNHGTFSSRPNHIHVDSTDANFTETSPSVHPAKVFAPFGGTTITLQGKFINGNSDWGGTQGGLDPVVREFADYIGLERFGAEFFVALLTIGANPAGPIHPILNDFRLGTTFLNRPVGLRNNIHYLIRVTVGEILISGYSYFGDDDILTLNKVLTPADGVVSVQVVKNEDVGHITAAPGIHVKPNSAACIALPSITPIELRFDPKCGMHVS